MEAVIYQFTKLLNQKDAVGLFYFAGHGVQLNGRNYLIPIGANIKSEVDIKNESIDVEQILASMKRAGNNLNIVILDASRSSLNVLGFRSDKSGLAQIQASKGSLVLYATAPGDVASDSSGHNSLFTQHLMASIQTANLKIEEVFNRTAQKVYQDTGSKQTPWQSGVTSNDFYFTQNTQLVTSEKKTKRFKTRDIHSLLANPDALEKNQQAAGAGATTPEPTVIVKPATVTPKTTTKP